MAATILKTRCTDVCHGATTAKDFGGFDMSVVGWEAKMIGTSPPANAPATNLCNKVMPPLVYLEANTQPAKGLFLDKFNAAMPALPCGTQMPQLPPRLTAEQLTCMQNFANNVVAGGTGL